MGNQCVHRETAGLVLLFGAEPATRDKHLGLVRRQVVAQEGQVPCAVGDRAQERVDFGGGERRPHARRVEASVHRRPCRGSWPRIVCPTHVL